MAPSASGPRPGKTPLYPLTAFRFFAALAIVVLHAAQNESYSYLGSGVSFFFILSGFVLTYVHPRIEGTVECTRFWVARLARIWPIHLFTLATVIILRPFGSNPFKHFYSEFFFNFFLLQCWAPVRRVVMSFNFVSWSISVELFFYLMFPFLLPLVFKAPLKTFLGTVALYLVLAFAAAWFGLPDVESVSTLSYGAFMLCPALHLYQFVTGMAVAVWWTRGSPAQKPVVAWTVIEAVVLGAVVLFLPMLNQLSLAVLRGHTEYSSNGQLVGFLCLPLFALLLYVFAFQAGILSRIFSHPWLVYLGDISFSTYMIHCIILVQFQKMPAPVSPFVKWGLFAFTCFCASAILYEFLEKPARKTLVRLANPFIKHARGIKTAR